MKTTKLEYDVTADLERVLEEGHIVPTGGQKGIKGCHIMVDQSLPGGHRLRGNCNLWIAPAKGSELEAALKRVVDGGESVQGADGAKAVSSGG